MKSAMPYLLCSPDAGPAVLSGSERPIRSPAPLISGGRTGVGGAREDGRELGENRQVGVQPDPFDSAHAQRQHRPWLL
jgi:hypothetical protein